MSSFELPPPLTQEETKELLKKLPNVEARETLISSNLRLVLYISKKYTKPSGLEEGDLLSIGTIGLIKAIDSYKLDKNVLLATYAARCIENEILMYMRKEKTHLEVKLISIDSPQLFYKDGNEIETLSEIIPDTKSTVFIKSIEDIDNYLEVINIVSNNLYKKSFRNFVLFLYMLGGKKQRYVAKAIGISQSYVSRMFKKLKAQCNSCNFCILKKDYDLYFSKEGDNCLCLEIKGYPLIRKTLEQESFGEIADLLRMSRRDEL